MGSPVLNLLPGGCDVMCRENGVRTLRTGQTAGIMINIPPPPPPPLPPFSFTAISLRATVLVLVLANLQLVSAMKKDSPPPHRGGEIVRGLPCIKKLNQLSCGSAGNSYPREAIDRFIDENKALIKRMYGEPQEPRTVKTSARVVRTYSQEKRFRRDVLEGTMEELLDELKEEDFVTTELGGRQTSLERRTSTAPAERRMSVAQQSRSSLPTGPATATARCGPSSTTRSSSRPSTKRSAGATRRPGVTETARVNRSTSGTDCSRTTPTTTVPGSSWTGSSSPPAVSADATKILS